MRYTRSVTPESGASSIRKKSKTHSKILIYDSNVKSSCILMPECKIGTYRSGGLIPHSKIMFHMFTVLELRD